MLCVNKGTDIAGWGDADWILHKHHSRGCLGKAYTVAQVNLSKDLILNVLITAAAVVSLKHIKQEQLLILCAKQMIHMGYLDERFGEIIIQRKKKKKIIIIINCCLLGILLVDFRVETVYVVIM